MTARQLSNHLPFNLWLQADRAATPVGWAAARLERAMLVNVLLGEAVVAGEVAFATAKKCLEQEADALPQEVGVHAEGPSVTPDVRASEGDAVDARAATAGQAGHEDHVHARPQRPVQSASLPNGEEGVRLRHAEGRQRAQVRPQRVDGKRRAGAGVHAGAGRPQVAHDLRTEAQAHQVQPRAAEPRRPRGALEDGLGLSVEAFSNLCRQGTGTFKAQLLHREDACVLEDAAQEDRIDDGEELVRGVVGPVLRHATSEGGGEARQEPARETTAQRVAGERRTPARVLVASPGAAPLSACASHRTEPRVHRRAAAIAAARAVASAFRRGPEAGGGEGVLEAHARRRVAPENPDL
mmetsp:Transcript_11265/g.30665  ORF Transcript_11265/g.30665 Transcript_11265/m.30665 type:complete len:353 (-) Transcript_11265:319-1377(-)